jgi:very-short-patch-repair endonuclease
MAKLRTKAYYKKEYIEKERSPADIADEHNTYPNKIRREIRSFGFTLRDKSEAQKAAIKNGRHLHPTKGKTRDITVRHKISASMARVWDDMSDGERSRRVQIGKTQWKQTSPAKKEEFKKLAAKAVRDASEHGSKLEQFIRDKLIEAGFYVEFHATIDDCKVDLYLEHNGVVVDIHGPTHFLPIWGEEYLAKRQEEDERKIKLFIDKGLTFIRVVHAAKTISEVDKIVLLERIVSCVVNPPKKKKDKLIQLEVQ